MAQFVGKWVNDPSKTPKNYDEFMDKKGAGQMKEKYRNSKTELEYTQDGDGMKVSVMNSAFPGKKSEFKFQYGKEFSGAGMDDSTFTATVEKVSDTQVIERGKNNMYGDFVTTRTIKGNIMEVSITGSEIDKDKPLESVMMRA